VPVPVADVSPIRVILKVGGEGGGAAPSARASMPRGDLGARDETSLNASADFCAREIRGPSVDYDEHPLKEKSGYRNESSHTIILSTS
jgi:hypothetical protein